MNNTREKTLAIVLGVILELIVIIIADIPIFYIIILLIITTIILTWIAWPYLRKITLLGRLRFQFPITFISRTPSGILDVTASSGHIDERGVFQALPREEENIIAIQVVITNHSEQSVKAIECLIEVLKESRADCQFNVARTGFPTRGAAKLPVTDRCLWTIDTLIGGQSAEHQLLGELFGVSGACYRVTVKDSTGYCPIIIQQRTLVI